ncbi:MAG: TolC family protein [Prevotella sp.]|uniref:TolC family protein n=1 Tax=Prevotella sp. TaxID=59823 RepID=UPI00257FF781|nr:TolC family protein [Prevotella sp.]MBS5876931.1 TolC family protein [Prevotella sp.]
MKITKFFMIGALFLTPAIAFAGEVKQWTLKECIDYAIKNNIKIQTGILSVASTKEDVKEASASLFPSLSFSTTHQAGYQPFLSGDKSQTDKGSYAGDYGLNATWTAQVQDRSAIGCQVQTLIIYT